MNPRINTQNGFTLLESLLTLFVLAVGMLGIAGMQMQSLRSGGVSMQRMAVSIKAQEMFDRVRANMIVQDPRGDNDPQRIQLLKQATIDLYATTAGADNACVNGTICTSAQMAAYDIFQWEQEMNNILPGTPTSVFTVNNLGMTIDVTWDDRGETYNFSVTSQL